MIYDGFCVSCKNSKVNIRCYRKTKKNTLYCGYHKTATKLYINLNNFNQKEIDKLLIIKKKISYTKIYNLFNNHYYKYLDKKYKDYLITGDTTWVDIPVKYRFKFNKSELWDIRFLISHFSKQLNYSSYSNASPQFPNNPFTRQLYSTDNLLFFHNYIKKHNFNIPIILKLLLESNIYEKDDIINVFNTKLRFQIINELDSQDNYIGIWIDKNIQKTAFEHMYDEWDQLPPYLGCHNNYMIPNPNKQFFKDILLSCNKI